MFGWFQPSCPCDRHAKEWVEERLQWLTEEFDNTAFSPEYMTGPMFGYALAHLAWFRGEAQPAWAKHLHLNARPDLRHGIKTRDSSFRPARCRLTTRRQRAGTEPLTAPSANSHR